MIKQDRTKRGLTRVFLWLAAFAILSLSAGMGLAAWGIGKGNPFAAIVGVVLVVDAGIVFLIALRFR